MTSSHPCTISPLPPPFPHLLLLLSDPFLPLYQHPSPWPAPLVLPCTSPPTFSHLGCCPVSAQHVCAPLILPWQCKAGGNLPAEPKSLLDIGPSLGLLAPPPTSIPLLPPTPCPAFCACPALPCLSPCVLISPPLLLSLGSPAPFYSPTSANSWRNGRWSLGTGWPTVCLKTRHIKLRKAAGVPGRQRREAWKLGEKVSDGERARGRREIWEWGTDGREAGGD